MSFHFDDIILIIKSSFRTCQLSSRLIRALFFRIHFIQFCQMFTEIDIKRPSLPIAACSMIPPVKVNAPFPPVNSYSFLPTVSQSDSNVKKETVNIKTVSFFKMIIPAPPSPDIDRKFP